MNRRYFFLGALGLAAGCSRRIATRTAQVSIVRAWSYSVDLADIVRRILIEHRLAVGGKNILLKPNLVEFDPHAPINTNPVFVACGSNSTRFGFSRIFL